MRDITYKNSITKIITFDPNLDCNKHLVKKLSLKCEEISKGSDVLAENYRTNRFILTEQLAITIVENLAEEIILFASLWQRPFYGSICARTMNRTWKCPSVRGNKPYKDHPRNTTVPNIVADHIAIAKENNIKQLFISREGGAHRYLQILLPLLEEKTNLNWYAPKTMFKTWSADVLSCWQNVLYVNVNNDNMPFALESTDLNYVQLRNYYSNFKSI